MSIFISYCKHLYFMPYIASSFHTVLSCVFSPDQRNRESTKRGVAVCNHVQATSLSYCGAWLAWQATVSRQISKGLPSQNLTMEQQQGRVNEHTDQNMENVVFMHSDEFVNVCADLPKVRNRVSFPVSF